MSRRIDTLFGTVPSTNNRRPRRFVLGLEQLEERAMFAGDISATAMGLPFLPTTPDIEIQNVRLLGAKEAAATTATSITTVPVGAMPVVHVDFSTNDLPTGYRVRYELMDQAGVVRDWNSAPLTIGAGQGFANQHIVSPRLWPVAAGTYTLTVRLDSSNDIAEVNETNNVFSINFVAAGDFQSSYNNETGLLTPMSGAPGIDWHINNYVDENPNSKSTGINLGDYTGGVHTYDGHEGIDFVIANFQAQDDGVAVRAAASGTVIVAKDDLGADHNTAGDGQGLANFIAIDHGNGWVTQYGHLRADSAAVSVGDVVAAGDIIGLVGSSGDSTESHLHFDILYEGLYVDPFFNSLAPNPTSYWIDAALPSDYAPNLFAVHGIGLTNANPATLVQHNPPARQEFFSPGQPITFWARLYGVQPTDNMQVLFFAPSGGTPTSLTLAAPGPNDNTSLWSAVATGVIPSAADLGVATMQLLRNGAVVHQETSTITNDPAQLIGEVQFRSPVYTVTENMLQAEITLVRNGSEGLAAVDWRTVSDTAQEGQDFVAAAGRVFFMPGEMTKTFTVEILDDSAYAGLESLRLELSAAGGTTTIGPLGSATLVIVDNDQTLKHDFNGAYEFNGATEATMSGTGGNFMSVSDAAGGSLVFSLNGKDYWLPEAAASQYGTINGSDAIDSISIGNLPEHLQILTWNGADHVTIGARNRDWENTSVFVGSSFGSADTLTLDDSGLVDLWPYTNSPNYQIWDGHIWRGNTVMRNWPFGSAQSLQSVLDITYAGQFDNILVKGSQAANLFELGSVRAEASVSLVGGAADDVFVLRDELFTLDTIAGNVHLDGGGLGEAGFDWAYLDDQYNEVGQGYLLTAEQAYPNAHWADHLIRGRVDRSGIAGIDFINLDQVSVVAGSGDDAVMVWNPVDLPFTFAAAAGFDTLDYSMYSDPIYVDLESYYSTGIVSLSDFESVVGGWGNDTIIGDAADNLLRGGWGDDFIDGRAGRDVLIGGFGADTLIGGWDEDLLIASALHHDEVRDDIAMASIAAEWSSAATYEDRIAHLTGQLAGGLNGAALLTPDLLIEDDAVDALIGAEDRDAYFGLVGELWDQEWDELLN